MNHVPFFLGLVADAYCNVGEQEEAMKQLAQAAQYIETTQERWAEAEILRIRGAVGTQNVFGRR